MSRKENCLDNSVIENFWGTLKSEFYYLEKFSSLEDFIERLHNYIHEYNYERDAPVLGYRTPVEVLNAYLVA